VRSDSSQSRRRVISADPQDYTITSSARPSSVSGKLDTLRKAEPAFLVGWLGILELLVSEAARAFTGPGGDGGICHRLWRLSGIAITGEFLPEIGR
jgi:hypothetical protein